MARWWCTTLTDDERDMLLVLPATAVLAAWRASRPPRSSARRLVAPSEPEKGRRVCRGAATHDDAVAVDTVIPERGAPAKATSLTQAAVTRR